MGNLPDPAVVSYQELRRLGATGATIEDSLAMGSLQRIARGWYALPGAHQLVVRAIQAGARLGCLSGCRFYGIWTPHHSGLHACYGRGTRPSRSPGVVLHPVSSPRPRTPVWPVLDCLEHVAHRHGQESSLIVVESALNLGLVSRQDVDAMIAELPSRARAFATFLSPAESGSETRVRLWLQQQGFKVRPQVTLGVVGRVDLLLGDRLIIECDSAEHHRSIEQYQEDRRRDLAARDLGFDVVRLS